MKDITKPTIYGIQGGIGSFNEEAVNYHLQQLGIKNHQIKYLHTTEAVMQALINKEIDVGQFAIHNSVGGMVEESVEAMSRYQFTIIRKFTITICHALMIRADANLEEIDTIMTHPQVLAQCQETLRQKYPRLATTSGRGELIDHALVAQQLGNEQLPKNIATMGSKILAAIHHLKIVAENLQDDQKNHTTFLQVTRI